MNKGQFNLDFEESMLLRSRLNRWKEAMKLIWILVSGLLLKPSITRLGREDLDVLERVQKVSKRNYNDYTKDPRSD